MIKMYFRIAESVHYSPESIINKINYKLVESGYTITDKQEKKIKFKNSFWQVGSRTKAFQKVDGGTFQLFNSGNETRLVLSYYISFDIIIFFGIFLTLASILLEHYIIYLMFGISIIQLLRIDNVKSLGKKMIRELIT